MVNNRWLTGSLLLGFIITVSLVSSIPTYKTGVMQKLLTKELEDHQVKTGQFPGTFSFSDSFVQSRNENPAASFSKVESIKEEMINSVGLPILAESTVLGTLALKTMYEEEARRSINKTPRDAKLVMVTGIEDHITLTDGRFPSEKAVDGVVEVLVTEEALQKRNMVLGTNFIVYNQEHDFEYTVKPVGAFQKKTGEVPYWPIINNNLVFDFIVHENWFRNELLEKNEDILWVGKFNAAFDYHEISDIHFPALLTLSSRVKREIGSVKETDVLFDFPIRDILKVYQDKGEKLTTMLWSLNVPVLIMLAIYLYMISRLIIERQLNEIAVFSSRGASRLQILLIYFIEVSILGLIAFGLGPFIGLQLGKILGASNGFLEFVQRSTLPVELSSESYVYAFWTVIASLIMVMIPVFRASGRSIVHHKQEVSRRIGKKQWSIAIFELALLGVSVYGLTTFNKRQKELLALNIETADLMIDPTLFFLPALFIIGFGIIALRIYPFVLGLIFKVGEKLWPLSLYSAFLQVSRSTKEYKFLMMFLVMTIGMGVFSASAARTINTNLEEQLLYANGSEMRVQLRWENNLPPPLPAGYAPVEDSSAQATVEEVVYSEPPFEPITKLKQVESTAKVFQKEQLTVSTTKGKSINYAQMMAIEPKDFGETAWFKPSLLPHHWYQYLNLMANEPSAALISRRTATELKVEQGDAITVSWPGSDVADFIVYGIVDYWPTFNPLEKISEEDDIQGALVVANLPYVQNMLGLEPYEVWLSLQPGTLRAELYEDMKEMKIPVTDLKDVAPRITELKNGALLLGVNGTMTMGFFISLFISFIGFLLYWIVTIKSRTLQYGIYRAMGMPMPKLVGMMVAEQVLTSGFACLLGVIVGRIASHLYVPLFKISLSIDQLMPPFAVVSEAADEAKIYVFSAVMLIVGSAILIGFMRKIKIDQAIKLGED